MNKKGKSLLKKYKKKKGKKKLINERSESIQLDLNNSKSRNNVINNLNLENKKCNKNKSKLLLTNCNNNQDRKKDLHTELKNIKTNTNTNGIMRFIDDELNGLSYNLAKNNDRRTYCQYYLSLLKTNHNLIFSFYNINDYNSRIIKLDLFFIDFTTNYVVNGLFFDDETMHKIYETKGSFNFEYQLPIIIYSSLISLGLGIIFKRLALSNDNIIKFKQNDSNGDLDEMKRKLNIKLKIKFMIFFILGFVFLIFFLVFYITFWNCL